MRRVKMIATACVTAAVVALGISATAQDLNPRDKTFLTFSGPVELPGVTLQAGTYVFRLADNAGRNVVQVLTQDERDVLGQWLFVQHERPDVTGETVVTFRETREGATPAVQYWYYPGEKVGKEFIYPKDQALRIAARTGVPVRSEDGEVAASAAAEVAPPAADASAPAQPSAAAGSLAGNRGVQTQSANAEATAQVGVVEGAGVPDTRAEAQAVGTSGRAEAPVSAQAEVPANKQAESQSAARDELPRTASPLALSGLLGLLSLAGAAGVRFFRA